MTGGVAIVNSSPLIILCRSGLLDVLHAAAETILIPDAVTAVRRAGLYVSDALAATVLQLAGE